ncbi:hypothetical protein [Demetria terragena]|uniref:hypothetical protein n=1 Tax=Demetria terragena TaxID=63959 RepID=UPI00037B1039|nr:hypothetical protein [Demetria terragena]
MMLRLPELIAIKAGERDLAFRRWDRPRVSVGTQLRTAVGLIEVTSLDHIAPSSLRADDARRSGHPSVSELRERLSTHPDRPLFRIGLAYAGPDPREALRERIPATTEMPAILESLDRLDRSSLIGPWTRETLRIIDRSPEVRAPDLAAELGRPTVEFKRDVRKLKEKGLTESLAIGYRLSPRGEAVLDHGGPTRKRAPRPVGTPLPVTIGAAATGALRVIGVTSLERVATYRRTHLATLHGIGPVALDRLQSALRERSLDFAPEE